MVCLFSIITICYNDPNLERTLKSIVNQTFQDYEWIVIDGGSNQETLDIFEKYKYRINKFVSEKDSGVYNAMNKGIKLASGEYLVFMNSGDIFFSDDVLEKFVKNGLDKDIIYGKTLWGDTGRVKSYPNVLTPEFWMKSCINHQSTIVKRELFEKYGLYNENFKIVSDYEKWIEFINIDNCSYKFIDEIIAKYDDTGISSNPKTIELLKKEREIVINKFFKKEEIKEYNNKIKALR